MFIDLNQESKKKYTIKRPGKYLFFLFNKGGFFDIEIASPKAQAHIMGIFIGKRNDSFEIRTNQRHLSKAGASNLLIKGVFFDQSKFIYQGTIKIEKEAQKSRAYQKNQNLIMSDNCFVDSRPFLEILANDVFCTHGSTTGKLDEEQIYYLRTRGIKEKEAKKLLIFGFLNEIFLKAQDLGFAKEIEYYKNKVPLLIP